MSSKDWGKLISRVLAVFVLLNAVVSLVSVMALPRYDLIAYSDDGWLYVPGICSFIIAVLLWVFADRFAPTTEPAGEADQSDFGALLIGAVAAYVFYQRGLNLVAPFFDPRVHSPEMQRNIIYGAVINVIACLVAAYVLIHCRRIARWMLR